MSKEHGERVAHHIRGELRRRGLTQADLAAALDLPQPSVSRRLSGLTPFTAGDLYDVAELFGCAPADLLPLD